MSEGVRIRPASAADEDFVVSLMPRLVEFGPPAWRDAGQMTAHDTRVITESLLDPKPGAAVFIAEDEDGTPLGFIHLHADTEHYIHEEHGHVEDVIVAPAGEGRGVGRALLEKAEEWARARGYRWLTLNVFAENLRAREVYSRLGYGEDMVKYVKELA
ncbi:MAG TPA: GNAT family N-acetyltransferase [Pyrinomonadaceae bacterium]|nr:GNAT family N-acetyltransferase [Pyrinomonadaceae bacterium]